jgi:hypothetical protein
MKIRRNEKKTKNQNLNLNVKGTKSSPSLDGPGPELLTLSGDTRILRNERRIGFAINAGIVSASRPL